MSGATTMPASRSRSAASRVATPSASGKLTLGWFDDRPTELAGPAAARLDVFLRIGTIRENGAEEQINATAIKSVALCSSDMDYITIGDVRDPNKP